MEYVFPLRSVRLTTKHGPSFSFACYLTRFTIHFHAFYVMAFIFPSHSSEAPSDRILSVCLTEIVLLTISICGKVNENKRQQHLYAYDIYSNAKYAIFLFMIYKSPFLKYRNHTQSNT